MQKEVNVKIFLKKNNYIVKFKSSHLKGEMKCKSITQLDEKMNKIISTFPDLTFDVRFSQGALGRYTWEIDSPILLYKMGYEFMGYIRHSDKKVYYNHELREFVVIDGEGWLKKYKLN